MIIKIVNGEEIEIENPTKVGKSKYPPDGLYEGEIPCTCDEKCPSACAGKCGCDACESAYYDAIDYD